MWKQLRHPNIVPLISLTTDPLQTVLEWMSNGTLIKFVNENLDMNQINLVSPPL